MKVSYIEDKIIIYMNKVDNIDFDNKLSIQKYFKDIFIKLKNNLNLELGGYYLVEIYKDINGIIIELEQEDELYEEIDMQIIMEETVFLYQVEDIFINKRLLNRAKIIKYNNNIYLKIDKLLSDIDIAYLHEISKIIYKNTENIIKYGRELPCNLV